MDQIAEMTNTRITTQSVKFKLNCSVLIKGLEIRPRDKQRRDERILRAETVYARFGGAGLLLFRPRLKKISIRDFVFDARCDMDKGYWNLAGLQIKPPVGGRIPLIHLKRGSLQHIRVLGGEEKIVAAIPIDIKLVPAKKGKGCDFNIITAPHLQHLVGS